MSVIGTVIAAGRLQRQAYRSIADEPRFWPTAVVVVALGAISHALLGVTWATTGGWSPIVSIVPALVSNLDIWLGMSVVGWAGGWLLGSTRSLGGFARAAGVAMLPSVLYAFGAYYNPILFVMAVWWLATTVTGVMGALELGIVRALAIAIAGIATGVLLATVTTPAIADLLR